MAGYRRIAVNKVIVGTETISPCVLEIKEGMVVCYYRLDGELPFTEWIGGTVVLSKDRDRWVIESSTVDNLTV